MASPTSSPPASPASSSRPPSYPPSASRRYAESALAAQQAARAARLALPHGLAAAARSVAGYQAAQAVMAEQAVVEQLLEQQVEVHAAGMLNSLTFTTELPRLEAMFQATVDAEFDRLVSSLVQDSGRSAESVAVTVRHDVFHVRFVNLPCCSRCAILAGRIYHWSTGFLRHPGCDCTMIPTTVASPLRQNPSQLVADGHVRGLSKADLKAIDAGADVAAVVNIRRREAGLLSSGRVLGRDGVPTPEGIYARAGDDRDRAIRLLAAAGYIR